jgi:hypothetical protein
LDGYSRITSGHEGEEVKIEYPILKKCDGCDQEKQTRSHTGLDPWYKDLENFICKKCDTSHNTTPKIISWNRKHLKGGNIFGLTEEQIENSVCEINSNSEFVFVKFKFPYKKEI